MLVPVTHWPSGWWLHCLEPELLSLSLAGSVPRSEPEAQSY